MAKGRAWGNALGGWRRQPRGPFGRWISGAGNKSKNTHRALRKKGGGFVPYRRHGLGHNTVGVNAGLGITKNRRVSFGFYVRTDTKSGQKMAMKTAKNVELAEKAVASRLPDSEFMTTPGAKLMTVKKHRSRGLMEMMGRERKDGNAYKRIATDRNGLPTYAVRYNSPKDQKKMSWRKRKKSVATYNTRSVTGKRTYDWTQKEKKRRPERRKAAARAGVIS